MTTPSLAWQLSALVSTFVCLGSIGLIWDRRRRSGWPGTRRTLFGERIPFKPTLLESALVLGAGVGVFSGCILILQALPWRSKPGFDDISIMAMPSLALGLACLSILVIRAPHDGSR